MCAKIVSRLALIAGVAALGQTEAAADGPAERLPTATPIKYLVILYPDNASFDRYFGVYPRALNPDGAPPFHARPGTPIVNGLTETLLKHNPNSSALIDQSSILRFIEDNWLGGQPISATSFDNIAGSIEGMFDFASGAEPRRLFLDPYTGLPLERPPQPDATP